MSQEANSDGLEARIERLENLVAQLTEGAAEDASEGGMGTKFVPPQSPPPVPLRPSVARTPSALPNPTPRRPQPEKQTIDTTGERWLARSGVLFLFLALSFLFKYAFDHGFITPSLRLVLGFGLASTLLGLGLKLHKTRQRYSQILLGGSIGMFYLVGFAAHQLYGLVPHTPAFSYMVVVTIGALLLSVRQDHPSLACIGASGGLMTPFLLATPEGTIPALVLYSSTIIFGASLILLRRGWLTLLLTLGFGGLPVLAYAVSEIKTVDKPFLWVGIIIWWMVGGWLPFLYNWKARAFPKPTAREPFPAPFLRLAAGFSTACAAMVILAAWELEDREEIWPVALCFGAFYILQAAWSRNKTNTLKVSAELASLLLVATIYFAWTDDAVYWALLLQAVAVFQLAKKPAFHSLGYHAHGLVICLTLWFLGDSFRAFEPEQRLGDPDLYSLTHLAQVFLLLWACKFAAVKEVQTAYRLSAHVALLFWSASELHGFENGAALTSAAWAVQGVAILLLGMKQTGGTQRGAEAGLEKAGPLLKGLGLATLALVAGKMLLLDMSQMDMIWRILMFFGVGGAFLALSFLINRPAKTT